MRARWAPALLALPLVAVRASAEPVARPIVAVFVVEDARTQKARLPSKELENLTQYLATRLSEGGVYKVVPNAQLAVALAEKKKASYNACYDSACQIEIGKEVAAQKSLATKIVLAGKRCLVMSILYDLRDSASERSADHETPCDAGALYGAMKAVAAKLEGRGEDRAEGSGPAAGPVPDDASYASMAKDLEKAKAAEAKRTAAEARRFERIEKAWTVVRELAETPGFGDKRKITALEGFVKDFGAENPHNAEAESMIESLKAGSGEMVSVPGGEFFMGCNEAVDKECEADEKPGRRVNVPAFRIDKTEVTVEAYARCVKARACSADGLTMPFYDGKDQPEWAEYCTWGKVGREKHPINCLDWSQAEAYCRFAKKRLPTEAEWEKAARGPDGRKYSWGNEGFGARRVANIADESAKRKYPGWSIAQGYDDGFVGTAPVGSFPAGASPYGALDMIGNVWEWTNDWYKVGKYRSARGGSWLARPLSARASYRDRVGPSGRSENVGVRCAQ